MVDGQGLGMDRMLGICNCIVVGKAWKMILVKDNLEKRRSPPFVPWEANNSVRSFPLLASGGKPMVIATTRERRENKSRQQLASWSSTKRTGEKGASKSQDLPRSTGLLERRVAHGLRPLDVEFSTTRGQLPRPCQVVVSSLFS